jgi:hypothetical protein
MHRSNQSHGRPPPLSRRSGVIIVAIASVLLSAGVLTAVRQLDDSAASGTRPASADGHAASPGGRNVYSATPAHSPPASPTDLKSNPPARRSPSAAPASTPAAVAVSAKCTKPQFVTSDPTGGWSDGRYYLYNDMWNIGGYSVTQTLYACAYNNWYAVADMNNDRNDGAVKTYPNVHEDFNEPAISSFHSISSTFAETSPHTGIYEDAYDIWINGVASSGSTEVMIWTENHHQVPGGSVVATVTFGGRTYKVWRAGSYIAFAATSNFASGTVNLLEIFNWIMAKGWMPTSSTLGQIDYGAEIVSTNSTPETFSFTNFTVSTS